MIADKSNLVVIVGTGYGYESNHHWIVAVVPSAQGKRWIDRANAVIQRLIRQYPQSRKMMDFDVLCAALRDRELPKLRNESTADIHHTSIKYELVRPSFHLPYVAPLKDVPNRAAEPVDA